MFFYTSGSCTSGSGTDYQSTDLTKKLYGIQRVARSFGFGTATGVGLPNEARGRVPDLSFKQDLNKGNPDGVDAGLAPG